MGEPRAEGDALAFMFPEILAGCLCQIMPGGRSVEVVVVIF